MGSNWINYVPIFCYIIFLLPVYAHWTQHPRYEKLRTSKWSKRQAVGFGGGLPTNQQEIELNVTVPYIFSARLYPFGPDKGDTILDPSQYSQAYVLKTELIYFEERINVIYVTRDGFIAFSPDIQHNVTRQAFPRGPKVIAPFWAPTKPGQGNVYFRETNDENILSLASSEVQIQYRYGTSFRPKSVFIATWDKMVSAKAGGQNPSRNTFQAALILSPNGSFAHMVYSRLSWHDNALAGFNDGTGNGYFGLPGAGTPHIVLLANDSDIGIPGEWLFKLDAVNVYLCGPGYKGLECIRRCDKGEWYYDCIRRCHCANNAPCHIENGYCPGPIPACGNGWSHPPTCDIDVDECNEPGSSQLCNAKAPDCINTPGSFICGCLTGFDSGRCKPGQERAPVSSHGVEVAILPQQPIVELIPQGVGVGPKLPPQAQIPPGGRLPHGTIDPQTVPAAGRQGVALDPSFPDQTRPSPPNPGTSFPITPVQATLHLGNGTDQRSVTQIFHPGFSTLGINATRDQASQPSTTQNTNDVGCVAQCGDHAHCKFINGGQQPSCVCDSGWSGDGLFCVDINECFVDNKCAGNSNCVNTAGSYNCNCQDGFEYSPATRECVDINECELNQSPCPGGNTSQCVNTYGSFECRCRPGFNGNPSSILGCIDINECLIAAFYCGDVADCENTIGGYQCSCRRGFQPNSERTACEDVDECQVDPNACPDYLKCLNVPGSFNCSSAAPVSGERSAETLSLSTQPSNQTAAVEQRSINSTATPLQTQSTHSEVSLHTSSLPSTTPRVIPTDGPLVVPLGPRSGNLLYPYGRQTDRVIERNSSLHQQLSLSSYINVFGHFYNIMYVSPFGLLLFDGPMKEYNGIPLDGLNRIGFVPLYRNFNLHVGGTIYFQEYADPVILKRATTNVREGFHDAEFEAEIVIVVTNENMPGGDVPDAQAVNRYQTVIAGSKSATYILFVYESLDGIQDGQAGIVGQDGHTNVPLPGSGGNINHFINSSNIQARGKWMYRVDHDQVIKCAAGRSDPPYCNAECVRGTYGFACNRTCQCAGGVLCDLVTGSCPNSACVGGFTGPDCHTDIDECAVATNKCHEQATCSNFYGGFSCHCKPGFTGDGFHCNQISGSGSVATGVSTSGATTTRPSGCVDVKCGANGHCILLPNGFGACTCNSDFVGDGIECLSASVLGATPGVPTFRNIPQAAPPRPTPTAGGSLAPVHATQVEKSAPPVNVQGPLETRIVTQTRLQQPTQQPSAPGPDLDFADNQNSPGLDSEENHILQSVVPSEVPAGPTNVRTPSAYPGIQPTPDGGRLAPSRNDVFSDLSGTDHGQLLSPPKRPSQQQDRANSGPATESSTSNLLVIIIPAVLCGVWLILIVVLMIVCLRRRKLRQRERFGMGYYVPSQSSPATSATGVTTAASAAAAAYQNGSYPTWTIPRPQPTYDFYQGAYYLDPFYATKQYNNTT